MSQKTANFNDVFTEISACAEDGDTEIAALDMVASEFPAADREWLRILVAAVYREWREHPWM